MSEFGVQKLDWSADLSEHHRYGTGSGICEGFSMFSASPGPFREAVCFDGQTGKLKAGNVGLVKKCFMLKGSCSFEGEGSQGFLAPNFTHRVLQNVI